MAQSFFIRLLLRSVHRISERLNLWTFFVYSLNSLIIHPFQGFVFAFAMPPLRVRHAFVLPSPRIRHGSAMPPFCLCSASVLPPFCLRNKLTPNLPPERGKSEFRWEARKWHKKVQQEGAQGRWLLHIVHHFKINKDSLWVKKRGRSFVNVCFSFLFHGIKTQAL